jgi:uncharacterized protein YqgV (UPF0045/DUF77 family)
MIDNSPFTRPMDPDDMMGIGQVPTPQAPVVPPVAQPAVPEFTTTGKSITTSTSQKEKSPGLDEQFKQMDEGAALQEKGLQLQADAIQKTAQIEAQSAAEQMKVAEQFQAEQAAKQAETQVKVDEAVGNYNAKIAEYENTKFEDFWDSKSTGQKIGLGIALALGAYGSSLGGGPNTALQLVQGQIATFMEKERAKAAQRLKAVELGKSNVTDALEFQKQELAKIAAKEQAAYGMVDKKIQGLMVNAKSESALAKLEQFRGELQGVRAQKRADYEMQLAADINKQVTDQQVQQQTGPMAEGLTDQGKPLTEAQGKAAQFFGVSNQALGDAEEFEKNLTPEMFEKLKSKAGMDRRLSTLGSIPVVGGAVNYLREATGESTEDLYSDIPGGNAYVQNLEAAANALLRDESGAALSESETEKKKKELFPSPNDDFKTLKLKQKRRRQALKDLRQRSGIIKNNPLYWEKNK